MSYLAKLHPDLPGATTCLLEATAVNLDAVEDEQDEEIETLYASTAIADLEDLNLSCNSTFDDSVSTAKKIKLDPEQLSLHLKKASEAVVVNNTRSEYERLWRQFKCFCIEVGYIGTLDDIDKLILDIPAEFLEWIAVWIMNKCDELDIFTNKPKHPSIPRVTYATAQKMRAAMTHMFGREFKRGSQPWMENPVTPGKYIGNPSLSIAVSQYMISLRRRKVRVGEVVTSARAVDEATMKKLWKYNTSFPRESLMPISRKCKAENPHNWGGFQFRMMLQLLYIVSLLCLLRHDEALNIMWSDVHFMDVDGVQCVRLDLLVRKTHQNGGISPFYLYTNSEKPWMCAVHAFALWWSISRDMGLDRDGYVFRKKVGNDRVSIRGSDGMTSESFLTSFRNNLCDVDIDPRMYGTHSFRGGGCQYLAMVLRWPLRNICTWGGWAKNFDNPGTIFKYLLSWTDTPLVERADYFNPKRAMSDPCTACGRTCHCA